jgi:hypothetical protein
MYTLTSPCFSKVFESSKEFLFFLESISSLSMVLVIDFGNAPTLLYSFWFSF